MHRNTHFKKIKPSQRMALPLGIPGLERYRRIPKPGAIRAVPHTSYLNYAKLLVLECF